MDKLEQVKQRIDKFNKDRDWDKFHSPSNLAKSISIEANELLECFQWDSVNYNKEEVCEELADVFTYCFQMAMKLNLDPKEIILNKLEKTKKKYPVDKAKMYVTISSVPDDEYVFSKAEMRFPLFLGKNRVKEYASNPVRTIVCRED